jgi:O-methyltransferase
MKYSKGTENLPSNPVPEKVNYGYQRVWRPISRLPGMQAMANACMRTAKKLLINLQSLAPGERVTYSMMGMTTNKNCDFMRDERFIEGFSAGMGQQYIEDFGGWNIHINQWAAFHALQLKGDFVECGVNRGILAMSNMVFINFQTLKDRKYYLFDTFCGLDEKLSTAEEYAIAKDVYPDCHEFVVESFKKYPNAVIVKGTVPASLTQVDIERVAYLSIDMNCAIPEVAALEYFWPKLEPSAIVLLDDYGWPGHENQKEAADNFALSVGTKVLSLPTGQGLILKPGK